MVKTCGWEANVEVITGRALPLHQVSWSLQKEHLVTFNKENAQLWVEVDEREEHVSPSDNVVEDPLAVDTDVGMAGNSEISHPLLRLLSGLVCKATS